jgi:hypothetical protein
MKGCGSCGYWGGIGQYLDRDDPHLMGQKVQIGACRRSAPPVLTVQVEGGHKDIQLQTVWPTTASDDWCGEWIPNYS